MGKSFDKFKKFCNEHKEEIFLGFVAGACMVGFLILSGNKTSNIYPKEIDLNSVNLPKIDNSSLPNATNIVEEIVDSSPRHYSCGEFEVSQHFRNLPVGQTHSAANEALAQMAGIQDLPSNVSYIPPYSKNVASLVM